MRRALVAVVAVLSLAQIAHADDVVASGHITATGSWTNTRSITVLTWTSGTDGFLFDAVADRGTCLTTRTRDGSGVGYNLTFNFHDAARIWLGACNTGAVDERCIVPDRANTGEITGTRGVDVTVEVVRANEPEGCRQVVRS